MKMSVIEGKPHAHSCPTLSTPWTVARQAPLSVGFSRQEHWSRLPFSSPGDLLDPGIKPKPKPKYPVSPALNQTIWFRLEVQIINKS